MISVSIGVFAYNEERTCGQILEALLAQQCCEIKILEILVISSASTDKTDEIVGSYAKKHPVIRLIREPDRRGKSAAINRYLADKHVDADVCVIASADILPDRYAIERLARALADPDIGMSGGRPIPVNKPDHFLGFAVRLQWELHHQISLKHPKCGEMIALRADLCESIPEESAVDEASLEAIAVKRGLKLKYIPDATFVNRGPDTFRDFISQRRRIACGHRWLSKTRGYKVATGSSWAVFRMLFNQPHLRPMDWMRTAGVIGLEAVCRFLGLLDYYSRPQTHRVWRIAASTKQSFESEELAGMLNHKETSQV